MNIRQVVFIFIISITMLGCISQNKNAKLDLVVNKADKITIEGIITENKKSSKDYYLVLYKEIIKDNKKTHRIVEFSTYSKSKSFKFIVNQGTYFLYACQNPEIITEERLGYEFNSKIFTLNNKNTSKYITVKMSSSPKLVKKNNLLISTSKDNALFTSFHEIKKSTLIDPIFSIENAKLGLWNPIEFYSKVCGGLYLLENFSNKKIPILFVHGMTGTPRDFTHIIKSIDKNKYQPMVYFYASGTNLNIVVDGLKRSMREIKEKYKINDLVIIAHSMGGLVSRGFINEHNININIDKFITLSTPWNGNKFAGLGGDIATRMVPSFGNMIPGSAYQINILKKPFPRNLKHYLFFGYKAKSSYILDKSNDGVISLSSQLFYKAQFQASSIFGYNKSHVGILKSERVLNKINDILK